MTGRKTKSSPKSNTPESPIPLSIGPSIGSSTIEPELSGAPKLSYDEQLMEFATLRAKPADELERFYKADTIARALDTKTYTYQEMMREGRINPSDLILESALLQKSLADVFAQTAYKAAHTTGINEAVLNIANNSSQLARTSTFQIMAYSHEKRLEEGASEKPSYAQLGMIPKSVRARRSQIKTVSSSICELEVNVEDHVKNPINDITPDATLDINLKEPILAKKRP